MVNKLEKVATVTKQVFQQSNKAQTLKKQQKTIEDEKLDYVKSAYLNATKPHIKNVIGYKVGDKHNSRVNNNGKEFIMFTKGNSHQVKQDNKATNHVSCPSNVDANAYYILYHAFDASYVLMRNQYGRDIALYVGPHHKRPKTCVWVPKVFVTNVKGPNKFGYLKTRLDYFL
jgi:hypothetical protein